ncbi:MAG: PASTA domain-containing protein [Bacteroidota bacterium]
MQSRVAGAGRWVKPVLTHRTFWLGMLALVGAFVGLFVLMNYVVMPIYTRQGAAVTVPEVRQLPFDQAYNLVEDRDLKPERRDQPFNPTLPRDAVIDQNPPPNASVKPGRRIYLYVNSGVQRVVTMPEVLTLSESLARSTLADAGLTQVQVREDEVPSPYEGTVTRQDPDPGETARAESSVTLWVSPGLGSGEVAVPDVRGLAPVDARRALIEAGVWVDPTRSVGGTVTRQEPASGEDVRRGTEVRIYSDPIDDITPEDPEAFGGETAESGAE